MPNRSPTPPPGQDPTPRLLLLGPVVYERGPRHTHVAWSYAKLAAMLAILGAERRQPVRREWLAALLWPEGDSASLRRALFDLRRELGPASVASWLKATSTSLQAEAALATDLDAVEAAWLGTPLAGAAQLDVARASEAVSHWRGDLAAGLVLHDADDFDLWLAQARGRWQQRMVAIASTLVAHHLRSNAASAAASVARIAVERAPDSPVSRADWWRCLIAVGQRGLAEADHEAQLARLDAEGVAGALQGLERAAAELALGRRPRAARAAADGASADLRSTAEVTERIGHLVKQGGPFVGLDTLLEQAEALLFTDANAAPTPERLRLARLAFVLRLHAAPWREPMQRLADWIETRLASDLALGDRLALTWPLATYHGWMGRGLRGEVLLRNVSHAMESSAPKPSVRIAFQLALALCHSCSTGNPEVSLRAARSGLRATRQNAIVGYASALRIAEANAALNHGDARAAARALKGAVRIDEPLRGSDLAHYHQIRAYLRLLESEWDEAVAEADIGAELATRLPLPMQKMACGMLAIAARAMQGEGLDDLESDLADDLALADRIGADGYRLNLRLIEAALLGRGGASPRAARSLSDALAIGRRCGVRRLRKLPPGLLREAFAPPIQASLSNARDGIDAARLVATLD
jgi:hypothetical protein